MELELESILLPGVEDKRPMMLALQDPAIANDNEKCNSLMQRYSDLRRIQSEMAKRLGDRVVLP